MTDWLRLVGVLVVLVGFVLRLRVSVVVLAAGLATGAAAGMPLVGTSAARRGVLDTLGAAFVDNRAITLFVLALPAVGLAERYGLQEQARAWVSRMRAATVARVELGYHAARLLVVALGIRLGSGHVTFSRPIVVPMALGAAGLGDGPEYDAADVDRVKAASGASENYANFFGQNLFPAAAGVGIVVRTLESHGLPVAAGLVSWRTVPIALASLALAAAQYALLGRRLRGKRGAK